MKITLKTVPVYRLHELLEYRKDTGQLFWKANRGSAKRGSEAGHVETYHTGRSYRSVIIDKQRIRSHRIVFAMSFGQWPENEIDHIDGDGLNNRIENLREVSRSENMRNKQGYKNGSKIHTGVYRTRGSKTFISVIRVNGQLIRLGHYPKVEDAIGARKLAEERYGFHKNHGISFKNGDQICA